jgi:hypothetical protein
MVEPLQELFGKNPFFHYLSCAPRNQEVDPARTIALFSGGSIFPGQLPQALGDVKKSQHLRYTCRHQMFPSLLG